MATTFPDGSADSDYHLRCLRRSNCSPRARHVMWWFVGAILRALTASPAFRWALAAFAVVMLYLYILDFLYEILLHMTTS